jgi:DNA-binding protein Fis
MAKYECCYDRPRDFSAIRKRIAEKYPFEYKFAAELGLNKQTLSRKLNSITPFSVSEICKVCELLDIPDTDIEMYFRTPLVENEEPRGLRAVIKEAFGNEAALARAMGMPKNTLCHRLNFQIDFRYGELMRMSEVLGIGMEEIVRLIEIERGKMNGQRS